MEYNIYLDESGNTGDLKMKDGEWNWDNQSYFALGSICIESNKEEKIRNDFQNLLNSFKEGLGTKDELKGKKKYKFKEELTYSIINILRDYNAKIYIDISNKKFKIATYIVEYCIYPYYIYDDLTNEDLRVKKINAANRVYNIDEDILQSFVDLCYLNENKSDIKDMYIDFLDKLSNAVNINEINESIENVKERIINNQCYSLKLQELFPIMDTTNKGGKTFFLPNIDAYNNIIASTSTLRLGHKDTLTIYHDEQKQFSNAIESWTKSIMSFDQMQKVKQVEFKNSKDNIIIQISDFITGVSIQTFSKIINSRYLSSDEKAFIKSINYLLSNCNIVCPRYEQDKFANSCGLNMKYTDLPRMY